jgi:hypothetical protein
VKPGAVLETISAAQSVRAIAKTDQEFPTEFALHELQKFLGILGVYSRNRKSNLRRSFSSSVKASRK